MTDLTLAQAQAIAARSLEVARERGFKPMAVVVVDAFGYYLLSLLDGRRSIAALARRLGGGPGLTGAVRDALQRAGIGLEFMDTAAACRVYNILTAEGRKLAAAMIAV